MKKGSIAVQLAFWFGASAFLLIVGVIGYLYWSLVGTIDFQNNQLLTDKAQAIRTLYLNNPEDLSELRYRVEKEWAARKFEKLYVRILDEKGRVLAQTPSMEASAVEAMKASVSDRRANDSWRFLIDDIAYQTQVQRIEAPSKAGSAITVLLALDCTDSMKVLREYREKIYLSLFFSVLVCGLIGWLIGKHGIKSVHQISRTAEKITSINLHERILVESLPVELASMGRTFNEMLDRLEAAFDRLSRFSADIAHELRTPIANLSGEIEVALGKDRTPEYYRDAMGSCLEEAKKISGIIDALLFLARCENPKGQLKREPINLKKELELVAEFYEVSAAEAGITCLVEVNQDFFANVERTLFQRAVGNLIGNSIKQTPRGGKITVSVRKSESQIIIEVKDTGKGIPAEHLQRVFDRFYRVDQSRSKESGGTGLGLAIVKSIATIHGGSVQIESELSKGTRVQILLPIV